MILEAEAAPYARTIADPMPADPPVIKIVLPDWLYSGREGDRLAYEVL